MPLAARAVLLTCAATAVMPAKARPQLASANPNAIAPMMMAKASPLMSPVAVSRSTTRAVLMAPSSPVASARTATVMV